MVIVLITVVFSALVAHATAGGKRLYVNCLEDFTTVDSSAETRRPMAGAPISRTIHHCQRPRTIHVRIVLTYKTHRIFCNHDTIT